MNRRMNNIEEVGYLEKGTGKHQSNVVYSAGGVAPTLTAALGIKTHLMILDMIYAMDSPTALTQTTPKELHLSNS